MCGFLAMPNCYGPLICNEGETIADFCKRRVGKNRRRLKLEPKHNGCSKLNSVSLCQNATTPSPTERGTLSPIFRKHFSEGWRKLAKLRANNFTNPGLCPNWLSPLPSKISLLGIGEIHRRFKTIFLGPRQLQKFSQGTLIRARL